MIIIGENINISNPSIENAIERKDEFFIKNLVSAQINRNANFIDINAGTKITSEGEILSWLIKLIKEVNNNVGISIDSSNPKVIEGSLKLAGENSLINSTTCEVKKFRQLMELAKEYNSYLIVLLMDKNGIPSDSKERIKLSKKAIRLCLKYDFPLEKIFLDPIIKPISINTKNGIEVLKTISRIKATVEVKIVTALSNISYGLPNRSLINRTFLTLIMNAGLDALICNPLDEGIFETIVATEAILGKDDYCLRYIKTFKKSKSNFDFKSGS